jgi:hypothetical protein
MEGEYDLSASYKENRIMKPIKVTFKKSKERRKSNRGEFAQSTLHA